MFSYTALGDSITAGVGATQPARSYPSIVVREAERHLPKAYGHVLAAPGWTSQALLYAIEQNPTVYLQDADAVTVFIGGDDLGEAGLSILSGAPIRTVESAMRQFHHNLQRITQIIRAVTLARITFCTQYNPFPNSRIASTAVAALNTAIITVASSTGSQLAPVHRWFAGSQAGLIAGYRGGKIEDSLRGNSLPIHPNDAGHLVIANGLMPLVMRAARTQPNWLRKHSPTPFK